MGYLPQDGGGDGCYDELEIGIGAEQKSYRLKAGSAAFVEELCSKFPTPEHRQAIEAYVSLCASVGCYYNLHVI